MSEANDVPDEFRRARPARALIVDDHDIVVAAFTPILRSLEPDLVITTADAVVDAIELARDKFTEDDVVFLDLTLRDMSGFESLQTFRGAVPKPRVAVISGDDDPVLMRLCYDAHVEAFIPKRGAVWSTAIAQFLGAGSWFPPSFYEFLSSGAAKQRFKWTATSTRIARYLAEGKSDKQIAKILECTEGNVRYHINKVNKAFGTRSRSAVVAHAKRHRVIE